MNVLLYENKQLILYKTLKLDAIKLIGFSKKTVYKL